MYKLPIYQKTNIKVNKQIPEGETIERKVQRIMNNKEPISDGAPLIYQERKDGVQPDYDPRTDKWDHAIDAMDIVHKTELAKREERHKPKEEPKPEKLPEIRGNAQDGEASGSVA